MPGRTIDELRALGLKVLSGTQSQALDRDVLLSHITGHDRSHLISHGDMKVSEEEADRYEKYLMERKEGRPIAYIIGKKEFMGRDFIVDENVLIPRPDTEILVEKTLEIMEKEFSGKKTEVLDMCSGSGAIGLSIAAEKKDADVVLADISEGALEISRRNAEAFQIENRTEFIRSDLFLNLSKRRFHLILSNPPYIRREVIETLDRDVKDYEPMLALEGGEDGLIFYRRLAQESRNHLIYGGYLILEIGHDQGEDVRNLLVEAGFIETEIIKDLAGLDRVVLGRFQ